MSKMKFSTKLLSGFLAFLMVFSLFCLWPIDLSAATAEEHTASGTSISNSYLTATMNNNGRLALYTVGGDPNNNRDNNARLLYGSLGEGTSKTVIRVGNSSFCFSASSIKKTPAGDSLYATMTSGGVKVECYISFAYNTVTSRYDTMEYKYVITNVSASSLTAGARIFFDTMLGKNDGAPFRVSGEAVTSGRTYTGDSIPQVWQVFDYLNNPTVVASGTFYNNVSERPDKVQFLPYGNGYHDSWDCDASGSLTDSAVNVYFNPISLAPGESRTVKTYYGLSSFAPEQEPDPTATLGLSAIVPTELLTNAQGRDYLGNPFTFSGWINNTGNGAATNVTATINLPEGLSVDNNVQTIGTVYAGNNASVIWNIMAAPTYTGKILPYSVTVSADGMESVTYDYTIRLAALSGYNVIYDSNGGVGAVPTDPVAYAPGSTVWVKFDTLPTKEGYVFAGWSYDPAAFSPDFTVNGRDTFVSDSNDLTLYAVWQEPAHEHSYTESSRTPSTCTVPGNVTYSCSCGDSYDEPLPLEPHVESDWIIDVTPTCTQSGCKYTFCELGQHVVRTAYIPATGHHYVDAVTKEVTCTEPGVITHTCACGDSYATYVYSEHHYEITARTEPTCTVDGKVVYTCNRCGDSYEEIIVGGHRYEALVTKVATPTEQGEITYTCAICGDSYTEATPTRPMANILLVQDRLPWTENINSAILNRLQNENYISGWDITTTAHFASVDLTQYNVIYIANDQTTATYNQLAAFQSTIESFARAGGVVVYGACDNGWAGGNISYTLPGGVSKGNYYSYYNYIADNAHNIVTGVLTDGKALTNSLLYSTYSSHTYFTNLPEGANKILTDANGRPTLVEYPLGDGYIIASGLTWEYTYVRNFVSGTSFAKSVYDDLLVHALTMSNPCDHVYSEGVVVPPTCTEGGYTSHTCENCGGTFKDQLVPALGHTEGEWEIVTEPTGEVAGLKVVKCSVCGEVLESEVLPPVGLPDAKVDAADDTVIFGQTMEFILTINNCDPLKALAVVPIFDTEVFDLVSAEWLVGATLQSIETGTNRAVSAWSVAADVNCAVYRIVLRAKKLTPETEVSATVLISKGEFVEELLVVGDTVAVITCPHENVTISDFDEGYHLCTCTVCGYTELRAHVYDNGCDTECNDCDHVREPIHTVNGDWLHDETNHWHVCDVCGDTVDLHEHTYDGHIDMDCNDCGYCRVLRGDVNGDGLVNSDDAVHLLMYTFFPADYSINQPCDFDGLGTVNSDDSVYLLMYTFFPADYPLH